MTLFILRIVVYVPLIQSLQAYANKPYKVNFQAYYLFVELPLQVFLTYLIDKYFNKTADWDFNFYQYIVN